MPRTLLGVAATVTATVMLTATPALASTAPTNSLVQQGSTCNWSASYSLDGGGLLSIETLGTVICNYGATPFIEFPNGTWETFAVGTSHAIWTAWVNSAGGWAEQSMGGLAYSPVTVVEHDGYEVEISVLSSSGGKYCNFRGDTASSGWSGWSSTSC
jgi:hypothetical protein